MTREKAIKVIEEAMPTLWKETKDAIQTLIPELAKSDDERMIDGLQGFLASYGLEYFGMGKWQKFDKWLEKHKEQKPAEWSVDIIQKAVKEAGLTQHQIDWFKSNVFPPKQEWGKEDERIGDLIYCIIRDNKEVKRILEGNGVSVDNALAYLEKQKEQKPTIWTEEDEKNLCNLITYGELPLNLRHWVAGLPEKIKGLPQKPTEWGDEDYEALDMCLSVIPKRWKTKSGILLTKWLKNKIRTQPKQEWHNVSEKTPKFGDYVIVACKNKNKEDGIWLYDLIQCWEGKWEPRENWETPLKWISVDELGLNARKEE